MILTDPQARALRVLAQRPAYMSNRTTSPDFSFPEGVGLVHETAAWSLQIAGLATKEFLPGSGLVAVITDEGRSMIEKHDAFLSSRASSGKDGLPDA